MIAFQPDISLAHRTLSEAWMNVNFRFRLWKHEVTTSYDLTESIGICGDSFTFWGRCSDWILTAQWPWAVLAVSTKQYVHTYHQMRHKSLSPQWTLNQVLVSGWEQRAAAKTNRAKREDLVHCIIADVKRKHKVGKCKQKLEKVFIRLASGGFQARKVLAQHICMWLQVPQGCDFPLNLQHWHGIYFLCSTRDMVQRTHYIILYKAVDLKRKKKSNINHNVMILFKLFAVAWPS